MPTKEFAIESINCPLTPKSHSFISPREFTKIFDGFTSVEQKHTDGLKATHTFAKKKLKKFKSITS